MQFWLWRGTFFLLFFCGLQMVSVGKVGGAWLLLIAALLTLGAVFNRSREARGMRSTGDKQVDFLKERFGGKILVQPLKTKIKRHRVFWIGRSNHDSSEIRMGIQYENGKKWFLPFEEFQNNEFNSDLNGYWHDCHAMTENEANALEAQIFSRKKIKS